jgi:gamma-glutamyl:cysteine ligase YbdK (ATP-grasp superfamily)
MWPFPPQVRQMAIDIVKGLTGSPEGIDQLKGQLAKLLLSLLRLVTDRVTGVSGSALTSLVNLSQVRPALRQRASATLLCPAGSARHPARREARLLSVAAGAAVPAGPHRRV